jgi:signal transduction histidine kinase
MYVRAVVELREDAPDVESPETSGWATALGVVFLIAVLGVAVFCLITMIPDDVVEPRDADFLDNIFADKAVLFAARLVLLSLALVAFVGATYIILSVFERGRRRQWLLRAGPFEVDPQAVSALDDEVERWKDEADETREKLREMRERLEETERLADDMHEKVIVLENEKVELQQELQARPPD